jgi:hypothetical protein
MGDLLGLAERFVRLNAELEETRAAMLTALIRPFSPAVRRGPAGKATEEAEPTIVKLLQEQPLGTAALARAMGARVDTTTSRLKRMKAKGLVTGGGKDGWRVTIPPA